MTANHEIWQIEILWNGRWVPVQSGFKTKDDAEWATGLWKQANDCRGNPFRAVRGGAVLVDPAGYISKGSGA